MRALFALFFAFLLAFEFARGFESARSTSESKAKLHRKSRVEKSQQKHAAKAESSNIRSVSTTYNLQYSVGNDEVFLPKGSFKLDHTRNARSAKESLKVMLMEDVKPKFTLENLRRNDIYRIRAFPENEDPESGFLTYIRICDLVQLKGPNGVEFLERIRIQGNSAGKLVTFNFDSSVFTSSLEACSESQQANVNMQVKTSFEILDAVLGAKVHKVEIPQIAKDPKGAESPQGLIALLSRYWYIVVGILVLFSIGGSA